MNESPPAENALPFIKWLGGKRRLVGRISKIFPSKLLKDGVSNYAEPFVGGGALFLNLVTKLKMERSFLNDTNFALINAYRVIKSEPEELIRQLSILQERYYILSASRRADYYYRIRDQFNDCLESVGQGENLDLAAWFIFLNKTCYNGIFRLNRSGRFNVPYGDCGKPVICDSKNIRAVSKALATTSLSCRDFKSFSKSLSKLDARSLIYVDPPYAIKNGTNGFLHYNNRIFSWEDQLELSESVEELRSSGASIIISNAAHADIEGLYPEPRYHKLTLSRSSTIGGTEASRKRVSEYVFVSYRIPCIKELVGWG